MVTRSGALSGLRVIDFGQYLAGPLVAMNLADLGADVIRVDPPGGPRWGNPANAALQRGKRSIVLDLDVEGEREVARRLLASADVAIENFRPGVATRLGIGHEDALAANPGLIYCSIPAFRHDDPRAGMRGWDGIVSAATGLYRNVPGSDDDIQYVAHPLTSNFAAMIACHSVAAALVARERTGLGQWIETSLFEAAFECFGYEGQKISGAPPPPPPPDPGGLPQIGHYRCADDRWIQLCLIQPRHLEWFGRTFFPQAWIDEGMTDVGRLMGDPELAARTRARLEGMMVTRTASDWEREINERSGAGASLTQSSEAWLRDDLGARDSRAVIEVEDSEYGLTAQAGYPIALSETSLELAGPRHQLDADRAEILAELERLETEPEPALDGPVEALESPLDGYTVLDLSTVLAGPTCGRILAEYGATVIKINAPGDNQLGAHQYTNSGKRSILLNLKSEQGREVFYGLLESADIVHANFARGVAEKLGVGEAQIRERKPDIIYSTISAFGHTGMRGAWRGREELGQALTGMQIRYGGPDSPRMIFMALNDFGAGNYSAFADLVALYHRIRTGKGQSTHASLSHTATFHQLPYMVAYDGRVWDEPVGFAVKGTDACNRLYRASDRWFFLAACSNDERAAIAALPELSEADLGAPEDAEEKLAAIFATRPAGDWVAILTGADVPAHIVLTTEEVMERPESKALGLSIVRTLPDGQQIRTVAPADRLSRTPVVVGALVNPAGGDGRDVLAAIGRAEDFDALVAEGVLAAELPPDADMIGRFQTQRVASDGAGTEAEPEAG